jgi:hypothetical protein
LGDQMVKFHRHAKQRFATEAVSTAVTGLLSHTAANS